MKKEQKSVSFTVGRINDYKMRISTHFVVERRMTEHRIEKIAHHFSSEKMDKNHCHLDAMWM